MRLKSTSGHAGFLAQAIIVIACAFAGAAVVNKNLHSRELAQQRQQFLDEGEHFRANIEIMMGGLIGIVSSMRATLEARPDITQDEFSRIAGRLVNEVPSGNGNLEIVNIAGAPGLVVSLVHPLEPNTAVLGLDYRTLKDQLPAVLAALESRRPVLSGPVNLVQGGTALLIRMSVSPLAEADPWGIVSIVVDRDQLFEAVGPTHHTENFDFAVTRISSPDNFEDSFGIIAGNTAVLENDPVTLDIGLPGAAWQLSIAPVGGWPTHYSDRQSVWLMFALFAAFLILIIGFIRAAQGRSRSAERRLAQAISAIDDGFALYGPDDRLLICNEKYRQYYPKSASKMTPGTPFREILEHGLAAGEYRDAVGRENEWLRERLTAHDQVETSVVQELSDGRWLKISEAKLEDGSTVGFRVDITELVRAREMAESSDRSKTEFLNRMSHELCTPLAVMMGYNSFLRKPGVLGSYKELQALGQKPEFDEINKPLNKFVEELSRNANKINTSGLNLLAMIDKILEFSETEKRRPASEPEEIEIGRLLEALSAIYKDDDVSRDCSVSVKSTSVSVWAEFNPVERAFECLFRQGIGRLVRGNLTVEVKEKPQSVDIVFDSIGEIRGEGLTIDVFDHTNASHDGEESKKLSLDLAIAERLLSRIGGTVKVLDVSKNHKRFVLTLPRSVPADMKDLGIAEKTATAAA